MNPDLKVPIRDRRRRKRIVTLKNFRNVVFIALLLFVVITIHSEMRGPRGGDYGRLYGRQVDAHAITPKQPEIVTEAEPVAEAPAADPFSLDSAAREQILTAHVEPLTPTQSAAFPPLTTDRQIQRGRIRIVGAGQTVTVEQTDGLNVPVLAGGFGRK